MEDGVTGVRGLMSSLVTLLTRCSQKPCVIKITDGRPLRVVHCFCTYGGGTLVGISLSGPWNMKLLVKCCLSPRFLGFF